MNFWFFFTITRPINCLIASIAVFIGYSVAFGSIGFEMPLLFAMLAAFLVCAGGQVINDVFDIKIDEKIRPEKILPSKKICTKTALIYSVGLFLFGLFFAFQVNLTAFLIALVFSLLLVLYSALIQKKKFLGNLVVALGTAFTLILGASIVEKYYVILFLASSAFFANVAREIIKDVQDKEADKGFKQTLPMLLSKKQVNLVVLLSYICAILLAAYVWFSQLITSLFFIIFLGFAAIVFLYSFILLKKNNPARAQVFSKIAMGISLIAFLAGVF